MTVSLATEAPNPAQLSSTLSALFPAGVVAAELQLPASPALLSAEEWQSVKHCHDTRIQDFTAGRLCAHRALQEFAVSGFSLLPADDRQPLWPPSLVGSITHTPGYSAAVVGERDAVRSLGVDTERITAVQADLWPGICAPEELECLRGLGSERRALAAALMFVAKEAFFKCQFPIAREWLGFREVLVEAEDWGADRGRFWVVPRRACSLEAHLEQAVAQRLRLEGRFRRHGDFVTAGMALPPVRAAAANKLSRR